MKQLIIAYLCFTYLTSCENTNNKESAYVEQTDQVELLLDSTDLSKTFHGSVLIADGQNILFEKSYGFDQSSKPNQIDTKYDIASMGKMFTSVAIMQLIEAQKLSLEQTVGEILSNYPSDEAKAITIEQLLSHTSGLGDFFGPEFDQNKDDIKTLNDYLPFFCK